MRQKCRLVLSNGESLQGDLMGAAVRASGEMVFTTGMVGYSEAITDPSYYGQILLFTYPLIGNYGIPDKPSTAGVTPPTGFESGGAKAAAVILSIDSQEVFHWNSFQSLDGWLTEQGVPAVVGIDTRHLVHMIRSTPNLLGRIEPEIDEGYRYGDSHLAPVSKSAFFDPGMHEVISEVSTSKVTEVGDAGPLVNVVDCGLKWNIVRQLVHYGCRVRIVPWNSDLNALDGDGFLISNGPGDPTRTGDLQVRVRQLLQGERPLLGICLGHQIVALAAGATTRRMPYGHRSHNQPVNLVGTRQGAITTQNHGYVVEESSIPEGWEAWFRNVNDQTVEGLIHQSKPMFSVQFHPEASGGPRDTSWIFQKFVKEVETYAAKS